MKRFLRQTCPGWSRHVAMLVACLVLAACGTPSPQMTVDGTEFPVGSGYKVGQPYEVNGRWYYPAEDFTYDNTGIASWYGPNFHGKPTANGERYDMDAMTAAHKTLPLPSLVRVTNLENGRSIVVRLNDRGPFVDDRIIDMSRAGARALGFLEKGLARVRVENLTEASIALKNRALGASDVPMPAIAAAPRPPVAAEALPPVAEVAVEPTPQAPTREGASAQTQTAEIVSTDLPSPVPATQTRPIAPLIPPSSGQYFLQAGAFADLNNALRVEAQLAALGNAFVEEMQSNGRTLYRVRLGPWLTAAEADPVLSQVHGIGYPEARLIRPPQS